MSERSPCQDRIPPQGHGLSPIVKCLNLHVECNDDLLVIYLTSESVPLQSFEFMVTLIPELSFMLKTKGDLRTCSRPARIYTRFYISQPFILNCKLVEVLPVLDPVCIRSSSMIFNTKLLNLTNFETYLNNHRLGYHS